MVIVCLWAAEGKHDEFTSCLYLLKVESIAVPDRVSSTYLSPWGNNWLSFPVDTGKKQGK
jgi:hypothetical protein